MDSPGAARLLRGSRAAFPLQSPPTGRAKLLLSRFHRRHSSAGASPSRLCSRFSLYDEIARTVAMAEDPLCVRCARHRQTCCQLSEVFVTLGDVQRITEHVGRDGFHHFARPQNAVYEPDDEDATWRDIVFRADGTRRVL